MPKGKNTNNFEYPSDQWIWFKLEPIGEQFKKNFMQSIQMIIIHY